jgi:hypothetical protein
MYFSGRADLKGKCIFHGVSSHLGEESVPVEIKGSGLMINEVLMSPSSQEKLPVKHHFSE